MIIAFTGQAGVGKTTAAAFAEDYLEGLGYTVRRFSFAASLKSAAVGLFEPSLPVEAEPFFGDQAAKAMPRDELGGASGRELLQALGTFCRGYNRDVFLNHLQRKPQVVQIIDDLRYTNEFERVRVLGGTVVGLRVRGEPPIEGGHASESEMLGFWDDLDFVVEAKRGDLDTLNDAVLEYVRRYA